MEKVFKGARKEFKDELEATNGSWRILRITSLVDLLLFNYYCYETDRKSSYLIRMFNIILKIKISYLLGELKISNDLPSQIEILKNEQDKILNAYDDQILPFKEKALSYIVDERTLLQEMNYLKVVCDLGLDAYQDDIFDASLLSIFSLIEG